MSILQLVGKIRKAFHIVCVPVGRDPDMVFIIFNDVSTITNSWYNKKSEKMILLFIAVHDLTNGNALMFNERDNPSTWNL